MDFIDTHCHLQFEAFKSKEDTILSGASAAGVKKMICVGTSLHDSAQAVKLANAKSDVWAAVGVHPHEAEAFLKDKNGPKQLAKLLGENRVVALGETGLDFYRQHSSRESQEATFRSQLETGLVSDKPFIFHVRDAWDDFWRILNDYKVPKAVVHSFSSGTKQLDKILGAGFLVGINGIATFSRDHAQMDAIKSIPLDRLLLETDAPFLTPEPFRGQICEPKHVAATAEFLAKLRDEPLSELSAATTKNAEELFGI